MVAQAALVCHRGAREVTRDELSRVGCPPPQGRWRPVPHAQVLGYGELADYREYEESRVRQMRQRLVTDEQAESVLCRAFELGIIGPAALPVAIDEWRKPSFPEFAEDKTAWRLYNALTFALGKRAKT